MVQAILQNRKTMTRRTKGLEKFNASPNNWRYDGFDEEVKSHYMELISSDGKFTEKYFEVISPYNLGDILWVRESFYAEGYWEPFGKTKTGMQKYQFIDDTIWSHKMPDHGYKYLDNAPKTILKFPSSQRGYYKRNSLFMPKQACRIFLKIKSIKIERLQDISKEDIKKEGVKVLVNNIGNVLFELGEKHGPIFFTSNINTMSIHEVWLVHWAALWWKINGMQSWTSNPFVWVYEFEQIEKPLDFIPNGQNTKAPKSF